MKSKCAVAGTICLGLAAVFWQLSPLDAARVTTVQENKTVRIQTWEYMILGDWVNLFGETIGTTSEGLAGAGAAGWEAVAVYPNGATLLKRRL